MSDTLRRNIGPSEPKERYGSWDLTDDHAQGDPEIDEPVDPRLQYQRSQQIDLEVRRLIARQRRLSLTVSGILFGAVLLGVVAGHLLPDVMTREVWGGFSPAVLLIGVLAYPLTWIVALVYVIRANGIDEVG